MSAFAISALMTAFVSLGLGIYVYIAGRGKHLSKIWFFLSLSISIWSFGVGMMVLSQEYETALLWSRFLYIGAIFIPILYLHFILTFLQDTTKRKIIWGGYILGIIFLSLDSTNLLVKDIRPILSFKYYPVPGKIYPYFVLMFFGYVGYALSRLIKAQRTSTGLKQQQLSYILLASAIGFFGGSTTFLPVFHIEIYPYGNFLVIFYAIIITYAITRLHLMDLEIIIKKGVYIFFLSFIFVSSIYLILTSRLFQKQFIEITPFLFISLVISFLVLSLGLFVFLKNPGKEINITFILLSLSTALWSYSLGIMSVTSDGTSALYWSRMANYGAVLIPVFYLHFILAFLNATKPQKKILYFIYFLTGMFLLANFKELLVIDVKPNFFSENYTVPGKIYPYFLLMFAGSVGLAWYELIKKYRQSSGLAKNQIKYVLIASMIAFPGGSSTFLPAYGINVYPYGYYVTFFYVILASYAIIKHHLMDINIVIKKGTVYTYLSFLILLPCMVFIIFAQRFFFGKINYVFSSLVFVVLLLSAIVFSKTQFKAERFIERTLFKRKYEHKKTLTKLSKIVISFLDEKELFKKTSNIFIQDLEIESISFFLLDRRKGAYILRAFRELTPKIKKLPKDDIFFKWLKEDGQIIVKEELERFINAPKNKLIVERLNSMESEVCIPLITRGELIGLINLGKKRSGDMYSHEDLELLANFANQAAVALENARLYEDMKKTQLLMRRTDRLAALGSLTAGLAHEIRNPLVAVNTFLQLLPERFEDKEFREEFLKLTTSEVERVTNLVNNLLDFARPSEPKLNKTDVNEIIEKVIALIRVTAKKKRVIINTKLEKIPQVMLDEEQIKQVFLNILLNAIEAIPNEGTIWVGSRSMQKNGLEYVQVEIEDTGKGIPKRILDHIFDPFFTTKEKGSGLGLSISHQIVQEHNGFIEVKSILGKGTTFFVNLPCRK